MNATKWVQDRIGALGLQAHPEGGHYREVYRSKLTLPLPRGTRSVLTAIHFVLPPRGVSRWHRVRADECWVFVDGDPIELATLDDVGRLHVNTLGRGDGNSVVQVVPAGLWQGARCLGDTGAHAVCTVAPGFDFRDFSLAEIGALARQFPELSALIGQFDALPED